MNQIKVIIRWIQRKTNVRQPYTMHYGYSYAEEEEWVNPLKTTLVITNEVSFNVLF